MLVFHFLNLFFYLIVISHHARLHFKTYFRVVQYAQWIAKDLRLAYLNMFYRNSNPA